MYTNTCFFFSKIIYTSFLLGDISMIFSPLVHKLIRVGKPRVESRVGPDIQQCRIIGPDIGLSVKKKPDIRPDIQNQIQLPTLVFSN